MKRSPTGPRKADPKARAGGPKARAGGPKPRATSRPGATSSSRHGNRRERSAARRSDASSAGYAGDASRATGGTGGTDARRRPFDDAPPPLPVSPKRTVPRLPTPEMKRGLRPLPPLGCFLLACREGYEIDVAEELQLAAPAAHKAPPRLLVPGLLAYEGAPPRKDGRVDLTFARQGFPLGAIVQGDDRFADRIADAVLDRAPAKGPVSFQWFVPDSDDGNRLAPGTARLAAEVEKQLERRLGERLFHGDPRRAGGQLVQLCVAEEYLAFVGGTAAATALSPFPGGRARMSVSARAPSRAAMKLAEAFDWLGVEPEPGDTCVDLGAAPGGWTWLLVEKRARVIAVDPGRLRADLAKNKAVTPVLRSAFNFEPDEPVEWLLCDMAWRPLEVAALLARWGRRRLARTLIANIKLPMKKKAEFVARVREIVETGGWSDVRTRHLYHDREEITLTAWRR